MFDTMIKAFQKGLIQESIASSYKDSIDTIYEIRVNKSIKSIEYANNQLEISKNTLSSSIKGKFSKQINTLMSETKIS